MTVKRIDYGQICMENLNRFLEKFSLNLCKHRFYLIFLFNTCLQVANINISNNLISFQAFKA